MENFIPFTDHTDHRTYRLTFEILQLLVAAAQGWRLYNDRGRGVGPSRGQPLDGRLPGADGTHVQERHSSRLPVDITDDHGHGQGVVPAVDLLAELGHDVSGQDGVEEHADNQDQVDDDAPGHLDSDFSDALVQGVLVVVELNQLDVD